MAEIVKRVCDVFPGARGLLRLTVTLADADGLPGVALRTWKCELSQRGRDRLVRFIERGLTKPTPKAVRQSKADLSSDNS